MNASEAYPRVTQVLSYFRLIDAQWFTPAGAWRGSQVHQAAGWHARGEDVPAEWFAALSEHWQTTLQPYFQQDKEWRALTGFKSLGTESKVVNERERYQGTIDELGKLPSLKIALIERKTGDATHAVLQVAAYFDACDPKPDEVYILQHSDKRVAMVRVTPEALINARREWLLLIRTWWLLHDKNVIRWCEKCRRWTDREHYHQDAT